jgi:hypothetical protein
MDSYGCLRIPRVPLDSYGFLWIPMDSHQTTTTLWIPMILRGYGSYVLHEAMPPRVHDSAGEAPAGGS